MSKNNPKNVLKKTRKQFGQNTEKFEIKMINHSKEKKCQKNNKKRKKKLTKKAKEKN